MMINFRTWKTLEVYMRAGLYQELNKSQKDFKPRVTFCRDKNGAIISEKETILKKWVERFDELLNVHELESIIVNGTQEDTEPASAIEEIEIAIKNLKKITRHQG
jgi:hypothetical protein